MNQLYPPMTRYPRWTRRKPQDVRQPELHADELLFTTKSAGIFTPYVVEVTHLPTGLKGIASDNSLLKARDRALRFLRVQLRGDPS